MLHKGRVRVEYYVATMTPDRTYIMMSVSKSITQTLAGILLEEGSLDTNDVVTRKVPELVGTSFEGCTIQDLLDFRAGIEFSVV